MSEPPASAPPGFVRIDNALPDVELPCFTGGAPVELTAVQAPAVLNLWGSWCEPCRAELPTLQRLADRTAGRLTVIGVNTQDGREAAASFAAEHGIALPTLFDPERKLMTGLGRAQLPVTVFLGGNGSAHVEALPLDATRLDALVRTWTGVTVTP